MGNEVFDILKGLLSWASGIAILLIGFAWKQNEEAHKRLHDKTEEAMRTAAKARQDASDSHSVLMDRFMEHVDTSVNEVKDEQRRRSDKLASHIERLFQNAEVDRKEFSKIITDHREESYKRHIELLHAINGKADK